MLSRATEITQQALILALVLSVPALAASLAAGLLTGLLGSSTQIQDPSVSHLPRLIAVTAVLVIAGAWGAHSLLRFTTELWQAIPALVQ
jgi:flagellar biosynthesis protein FliQ